MFEVFSVILFSGQNAKDFCILELYMKLVPALNEIENVY